MAADTRNPYIVNALEVMIVFKVTLYNEPVKDDNIFPKKIS